MIEKLLKAFQELKNCRKKYVLQYNIIIINDFIVLLYALKSLNTDKINLAFQNKLINTVEID